MKIFSTAQIRQWDQFTIQHEPILSIDLMERAASKCAAWLLQQYKSNEEFLIFCGMGNNGGDGLAIARMLATEKRQVSIFVLDTGSQGSPDFSTNLDRLNKKKLSPHTIRTASDIPKISSSQIVIDALFGSGLNRPFDGLAAELVAALNNSGASIISIDIPSGMFSDKSSISFSVIHANNTLAFQVCKLAFLLPENAEFTGDVVTLDIGLHKDFKCTEPVSFYLLEKKDVRTIFKPRKKFSHKGTYGHAIIFSGSYGMMGAAILSIKSCLRSGVGKATAAIPACGVDIMQSVVPESICEIDPEKNYLKKILSLETYSAIGIGPGIGTHPDTAHWLHEMLKLASSPLVLDADALNILSNNKDWLNHLPPNSIITPHPKEFERLFGKTADDFKRVDLALNKARELGIYIIVKGFNSLIACPDGQAFFNTTGNPGMATAGSGDVLTGILTGLLAQGYTPADTCKAGVFLHGLAGDMAAAVLSEPALIAGDLSDYLGKAYLDLNS